MPQVSDISWISMCLSFIPASLFLMLLFSYSYLLTLIPKFPRGLKNYSLLLFI